MIAELVKTALQRAGEKAGKAAGMMPAVADDTELSTLLAEHNAVELALLEKETAMNREMAAILERYVENALEQAKQFRELEARIKKYAQENRDRLLRAGTDDEDGKSVDMGVSWIRFRNSTQRVQFVPSQEAAVNELEAKNLHDFFKTETTVLKEVCKAHAGKLTDAGVETIRVAGGKEKVYIEPKREKLV